jgi:hypothetical protein
MERIYLLVRTTDNLNKIPSLLVFFSLYGWSAASIESQDYQLIIKFNIKYFEITKSNFIGFKSFGAGKSVVNISVNDPIEEDINFNDYEQNRGKIKIPVTQSRYDSIVSSMKLLAKVLLEEEYDKRFIKLRYTGSELETQTWNIQLQEVEKFNSGQETPLLSAFATAKQISIEELVSTINTKVQEYNSAVQNLMIELLTLKTEFNTAITIEDLNVLYAKYFGQQYYISEEYKESRPDVFDENGQFKFTIPLVHNF